MCRSPRRVGETVLPRRPGGLEKKSIDWGPSDEYGEGSSNTIALNGEGKYCVEVHVLSGKLYYRVGQVDYRTKSIAWGRSTETARATPTQFPSVPWTRGGVAESHVKSGKLFYRVGVLNAASKTISWKEPSQEYGTGSSSTISNGTTSKVGYCIEVHNNAGNLFYGPEPTRTESTP